MNLYPLLMTPCFVHGATTPWGGSALKDLFNKDAPNDAVGASLEVCVTPGEESMVSNGAHTGKTLARMVELWGEALTGCTGDFPLLLKLLDAEQNLSVQVHPDDATAQADGLPFGRHLVWVILNAEPGAKVVYGMDAKGDDLRRIVAEGRLEECLHWETVLPGDVFYIPAGLVYALGAGVQCYEIQGNIAVSYRLWDWNRVDAQGNARPLQVEKALELADAGRRHAKNEGTTVLCKGGSRTYYVSDKQLELCRLNVSGNMPLESGRMLFLTPLGECVLQWGDEALTLDPFQTVVIPAALQDVSVRGNTKVLMSSLPDRERLRAELDYRAENVAGLMDE